MDITNTILYRIINSITIRHKLIFAPIVMVMVFTFIGTLSFLASRATESMEQFDHDQIYLQMMLRGVNEIIITEGTPQSIEIAKRGLDSFNRTHKELVSLLKEDDRALVDKEITEPWNEIVKDISPFLDRDVNTEDDDILMAYGRIITRSDKLAEKLESVSHIVEEKTMAKVALYRNAIRILVFILVTGAIVLSILLYGSIMHPINDMKTMASAFSTGKMSATLDETRKDEFGELAVHFNQAARALQDISVSITSITEEIAGQSSSLGDTADGLYSDIQQKVEQTEQSASAMNEMSHTILDVAKNAGDASDASKHATDEATQGRGVVIETAKKMSEISESVSSSESTLARLGVSSENIGTIVGVINDIADQTNLLALNAAIEAARAGDHGRGFAVVADEVRKLSERTANATGEIVSMIESIQGDIKDVTTSMDHGKSVVEEGVLLVEEATKSLDSIVEVSKQGTDMVQRIAAASEEQSTAVDHVLEGMELISSATKQTESTVSEIRQASERLTKTSKELEQIASWFNDNNNSG